MNINVKETVMQFCLWRILLSGDIRNITSSQWSLSVLSEKKENQRFADFLGCTDVLSFLFSLMSWVRLVVFCITFFFLCPLHPTVLFLCILKKSANLWSFFFREYRKRPVGWSELIGIRASHSSQSWISITRQGLAARGKFIITDYLTEQLCNLLNCTTLEWWIVRLRVLRTFRNNRQELFYEKRCSWTICKIHRKFTGFRPATLLEKRHRHKCFLVNFAKYLETSFLWNTSDGCFWTWESWTLDYLYF